MLCVLAVLLGIISAIIYTTNPDRYKILFVQQFEKETGQKIELKGPVEINLMPLPHANLNQAILKINMGKEQIVIAADYLGFTLTWQSLISDIKKIRSIHARNVFVTVYQQNKIKQQIKIDHFEGELINAYLHMDIPSFSIKLGKNTFEGNMKVSFDKATSIVANLKSEQWDADNLVQTLEKNDEESALEQFLRSDWLKQMSAEVTLEAKSITSQKLKLTDAKLKLKLNNSVINALIRGKMRLGELTSNVRIEKAKAGPEINLTFKIRDPSQQNDREGNFTYTLGKKQSHIIGKLKTQTWVVDFIPNTPTKEDKVFSSLPFDVEWPQAIVAKVDFQTDRLIFENFILEEANLALNLNDSLLEVIPEGKLAQGHLTGKLDIENKAQGMLAINGKLALKNADAALFLKMFDQDIKVQGGIINANVQGTSIGKNIAEMMAHLSGKTLVHIQQMTLENKAIDSRYVDIFAAMLKALKPTDQQTAFECIAWRLNIKDGIVTAKEGIAIETPDLYALGSGTLDLGSEELNFMFNISPRSQINIEIGSMDTVAFLKGTLASPVVKSSARALIKEGSSLMLGLATGGTSLLAEKLYKVMTQKGSPCKHVLIKQ